jgi:hypothetical protein
MSIPTAADLMVQDMTLHDAAAERVRLIETASPQERYWAYGAEIAAIYNAADRLAEACGPADLEALIPRLASVRALLLRHQDDIVMQHGDMKVFDPALIERMFSKDVQPLWPGS